MPIHESDQAEKRWQEAEWNTYELWEKLELKQRRKRRWIMAGATTVFLMISAIPVIREWRPKWKSLSAAREVAQEVDALKLEAIHLQSALRIRRLSDGEWVLERGENCNSASFAQVRSGNFSKPGVRWVSSQEAERRSLQAQEIYCYNPFVQEEAAESQSDLHEVTRFAFASDRDLNLERTDRIGVLTISGLDGILHFD
jgi:hypothetical protein